MSRDTTRRAERAEAALRVLRQDTDAVLLARLSNGPMLPLIRVYSQLDRMAEPLAGRQIESSRPPHPFDRPMPHVSTAEARHVQSMVDRAFKHICNEITDFLNEQAHPHSVCLACGRPADRTGRPPSRRRMAEQFLTLNLRDGPIPEEPLRAAAAHHDISRQTLRRAAEHLGVRRVFKDGQWMWQLGHNTSGRTKPVEET